MANTHRNLYSDMSHYAFELYLQDLDTLKSKYRKAHVDLPKSLINTMKRQHLIDALLTVKFGSDNTISYLSQCKDWDIYKSFVEN